MGNNTERRIEKLEEQSGCKEEQKVAFYVVYSRSGDSDRCHECSKYKQTLKQPGTVFFIPNQLCKGCEGITPKGESVRNNEGL